jgi:hypothetical protein
MPPPTRPKPAMNCDARAAIKWVAAETREKLTNLDLLCDEAPDRVRTGVWSRVHVDLEKIHKQVDGILRFLAGSGLPDSEELQAERLGAQ